MTLPTTNFKPSFSLYNYLTASARSTASTILGGSASPSLSLSDLIDLSNEPEKTRQILTDSLFSQRMDFGSTRGSPALRTAIASTYASASNIKADNILVTNATTGANHIVERSLLSPGDHIIVQYPIYGPCIEEPTAIGCNLSYLRTSASNGWRVNPDELRSLIQPGKTKMVFLNSPGNPTGSYIDSDIQRSIIEIAKEHDLVIHCDEIFRPLFHNVASKAAIPPSFVEHPDLNYDRIVVTSSLSKCYGLSGVRVGWITTRAASLYEKFLSYWMFSVHGLSRLDESVATETLSPRCRFAILQKRLSLAKHNLSLIEAFVQKYENRVDWVQPTAGTVAFMRFLDPTTGKGRDEFKFCEQLFQKKGILLSPGGLCFEFVSEGEQNVDEFRGYVRLHFVCSTTVLEAGLDGIARFLDEEGV